MEHEIKTAIDEFKTSVMGRIVEVENELENFQVKMQRPGAEWSGDDTEQRSAHTKSFLNFMRSGRESELQKKALSTQSDQDGGYLVPAELDNELTKYLRQRSPMRQLARVIQVGGAEFKQPASTGGTASAWVGETSARPETTSPGFKMLTIPTSEIYANCPITQNLLDDNQFDLGNWLVEELGDAFGDGEADAFINGDGVARPRGLFTYSTVSTADATRAHDAFQYIPSGASGAFASVAPADALITLVYALKAQYRQNAAWLMSPEVISLVRRFKGIGTNDYIFQPALAAGQPATLLGYPVYEDENISAVAANSLGAAFGDFGRAYTVTDRSTSLIRDQYTNKPYVNFYASKRVGGGGGRDTRAVKFLKFAAS